VAVQQRHVEFPGNGVYLIMLAESPKYVDGQDGGNPFRHGFADPFRIQHECIPPDVYKTGLKAVPEQRVNRGRKGEGRNDDLPFQPQTPQQADDPDRGVAEQCAVPYAHHRG
jgi:hypothetical protein